MLKYILYRLFTLIPVLLGVSLLVFSLFWVVPGDVVDIMTGDNSFGDAATAEALRKSLNIGKPFYVQYGLWLMNVLQGDLGVSFITGQKVADEILRRLPVNFQMIAMAMVFIVIIGIPIGILSAYRQFTWFDHCVRFATTLGYSIPNFWAATIVVLLGSVYFKWLPVLNYVPFSENPWENIRGMLLPGFVLGLSTVAFVTRMARSSALDTLRQDYVRTARAKGASESVVLFIHVMKNSLIPVVTILGVQIGVMIGGFVLTEQVFVLPGVGSLLLMSIQQRDLIMATGVIMCLAVINVIVTLLVDIAYTLLDPRIKY
jgi:peptide/nickel transport system permease protein